MADDIEKLMAQNPGMSLTDAINQNIVTPIQNAPAYKNWIANNSALKEPESKYDYKPIQSTDANGNLITTGYMAVNKQDPTDYRIM